MSSIFINKRIFQLTKNFLRVIISLKKTAEGGIKMQKFNVTGMSCAACSARVEKAICSVSGVTACSVSLLTGEATAEGTASSESIIDAVKKAGYGASVASAQTLEDALFRDTETPKLRKRLIISSCLLLVLMYFSMGSHLGIIPAFLSKEYLVLAFLQLALSLSIIIINRKFFINGAKGAIKLSPNMDTLVSLGSGISFIYSLVMLVLMCVRHGDAEFLEGTLHKGLYFESAAMILVLITLGKMLESISKKKTTSALKNLIKMKPKTALVSRDGKETEVSVSEIKTGDEFIIKAGGIIPVDGFVISGEASIDESCLTGESIPSDKASGARVYASTVCKSGYIVARAEEIGEKTAISKIIKTVSDALGTKAPIAKIADTVSGFFVPVVILIAIISTVIWLLCGSEFAYALERGISVLVISCPCALGLATPVAIMVGGGIGAKKGILFKDAGKLELLGKCEHVLLDKTGTITQGVPEITDIIPFAIDESELLSYAYTLEKMSEHPLARAINDYANENSVKPFEISSFKTLAGSGVCGEIDKNTVFGASYSYTISKIGEDKELKAHFERLSNEGKTPLFFVKRDTPLGIIAVRDKIKDDSRGAISALKEMGLTTSMVTGDNEKTACAIAKSVGIDHVISEVMPNEKAAEVTKAKSNGRVIMVGDGINDAPALATADVGVAIGAGTDVAIDTADVVLVKSSLSDLVTAIKLSRATLINIKENLFWAFIYNVIGIPLAAGAFIAVSGGKLTLTPMLGALLMSFSSVSVVLNALRLNLFNEKKHYKRRKKNINKKEKKEMNVILKVEGMMCPHCEAHVKKALEAIDGVSLAVASHTKGEVEITLSKDVSIDVLKKTVTEQGYTVK